MVHGGVGECGYRIVQHIRKKTRTKKSRIDTLLWMMRLAGYMVSMRALGICMVGSSS